MAEGAPTWATTCVCARAVRESQRGVAEPQHKRRAMPPDRKGSCADALLPQFRKIEETPAKRTAKGQAQKKRVLVALMGQGSSMLAAPGSMRICDVYTDH